MMEKMNSITVDLDSWLEMDNRIRIKEIRDGMRGMSKKDLRSLYEITVDLFSKVEADRFFRLEGLTI